MLTRMNSTPSRRWNSLLRDAFAALMILVGAPVSAQQPVSIPGLVVTLPPSPAAAPVVASPVEPPAAAAKAAPKPKPKAKGPTTTASTNKAAGGSGVGGGSGQGIAALVNDEPITAYEVEKRAGFLALSANIQDRARANMKAIAENPETNNRLRAILEETIKANPGKTREQVVAAFEERKKAFVVNLQKQAVTNARASALPGMRKTALDELIEERLKLQAGSRQSITVSNDDVETQFKGMAQRNKMTSQQFEAHVTQQGADPGVIKARLKASLTWREVIRRRFGPQINVSSRDVDKFVAASPANNEEIVELQIHKITLSTPGKLDQKAMALRLTEAEALRAKFSGCKATATLAKAETNATFEDLGTRKAATISEPTRSLLLQAKEGEMLPATLSATGVELYALCGRRTAKVDEQKRQQAENELTMKEFERLSQRHLFDLKKDSLIEIR